MHFLMNLIRLFPAEVIFLEPDMEPPGLNRVITGYGDYVITGNDEYVVCGNQNQE